MDIEQQLYDAMDKAASHLIQVLEDDSTTTVDGKVVPNVDLKTKMAVFNQAQEWLTKRPKLRPRGSSSETEGIDLLRDLMADPERMVDRMLSDADMVEELKSRGWLAPSPRRPGRPTTAESQTIARRKARKAGTAEPRPDDDDSQLSKLVR